MAALQIYASNSGTEPQVPVSGIVTVDLGVPAEPGHSLIVGMYSSLSPVLPSDWTTDFSAALNHIWMRLAETVGGEQTFDFTTTTGLIVEWCIWETDLTDPLGGLDAFSDASTFNTVATTQTTGDTGTTGTLDTVNLAMHTFAYASNSPYPGSGSWDSHTNGFVEDHEEILLTGNVYYASSFSSMRADGVSGPFSCTATVTASPRNASTDSLYASIVSYRAPGFDTPWNQGQGVMVG